MKNTMAPNITTFENETFENFNFDPFNSGDILVNDEQDPDSNFFNDIKHSHNTSYFLPNEAFEFLSNNNNNSFSLLHINIRSLKKNIDSLKLLLSEIKFEFKTICLTETWCNEEDAGEDSLFHLPQYTCIHQVRSDRRGGSVCIYVHNSLTFKKRDDLCTLSAGVESLSLEILNTKTKNTILNVTYRPPDGSIQEFETFFNSLLSKTTNTNKNLVTVGDFNLNLLDYSQNNKVKNYVNKLFQHNLLPMINKPTRVSRKSISIIDHINTNFYFHSNVKSGIIKTPISDHFPVFMSAEENSEIFTEKNEISHIYKRIITDEKIQIFKSKIHDFDWQEVLIQTDTNKAYMSFLKILSSVYDEVFPKESIRLKTKSILSPWITTGIRKSSKKKQKLYQKFLKRRTSENEARYIEYRKLFESIRKKAKKSYYSKQIIKHIGNIKKSWEIMKEIIGKSKVVRNNLPKLLRVNNVNIFDKTEIANKFNQFFVEIGPNLAEKITPSKQSFETYMNPTNTKIFAEEHLSINELKDAFFTMKSNKSPGVDEIDVNVVKKCFGTLATPLHHIFDLSLSQGIFPDSLKVAKVTPIYKKDDPTELGNYRPISVLPCFSKVLERIMYNRLYKHLKENSILYNKQFGFQKAHSTEHAILELIDKLLTRFEQNEFTLGVFIDLSKAFDTVDHSILLRKLEIYGVKGKNLSWFQSYLSNRKQCVSISSNEHTSFLKITCGVPQGSILGPLLFILYINDLKNVSKLIDPIMFADDTNLFTSHKDVRTLINITNNELKKLNDWFTANKLSLNTKKTQFSLFHKSTMKDSIPLKIPKLTINDKEITRCQSVKFLGVLLDENINWKDHISTVENKISKNIGLLYRARPYLNKESMVKLYYSYIHCFLNYANLAWASTNKTNLHKIHIKQKHAIRVVANETRYAHSKPLMRSLQILNIYQLNIHKTLIFMHQVNNSTAPSVFQEKFKYPNHKYPTKFSKNNFLKPKLYSVQSNFRITSRGPTIWNKMLSSPEKELQNALFFKAKVKEKILAADNETEFF